MAQKTGALIFDETADRYDIRFDIADYYGGLHCGECMDVYLIPQFYSLLFPEQDITEAFIYVFVGIMFIISGNYFPKNHINPYVGLKFPWLFNDEESWYKTHKLGSYTWLLSGLVFILHPLHKFYFVTVPLIILLVGVVPLAYSLFLYFRRKKNT